MTDCESFKPNAADENFRHDRCSLLQCLPMRVVSLKQGGGTHSFTNPIHHIVTTVGLKNLDLCFMTFWLRNPTRFSLGITLSLMELIAIPSKRRTSSLARGRVIVRGNVSLSLLHTTIIVLVPPNISGDTYVENTILSSKKFNLDNTFHDDSGYSFRILF